MNKRIKELAADAGFDTPAMYQGGFPNDETLAFQFFAESIVRECINIVKPTQEHQAYADSYMGGVDGLDLLYGKIKQIKEHFGIKE